MACGLHYRLPEDMRKDGSIMKRTVLALASWLLGAGALGLGVGVLPGSGGTARAEVTVTDVRPARFGHFEVSVGMFYDSLSPYGDWVYVGRFGRVWRPSPAVVGVGFRPYATGGEWVYTDYGWSFETEWDWGWAPFHYGRWYLDSAYGWVWVPDTTWGPSWVDWRFGGGYVGWAP